MPDYSKPNLPALYKGIDEKTFSTEREILYKVLFDMKKDMNDLKKLVYDLMDASPGKPIHISKENERMLTDLYTQDESFSDNAYTHSQDVVDLEYNEGNQIEDTHEFVEESLSIEEKEKELIEKALEKYKGKRKAAAHELGISERTLYRKIKEYEVGK